MSNDLESVVRELRNSLDTMEKQLAKLTGILLGDPSDPAKPGVPIRLDRLEQSNKLKNKVLMLLATGMLTALGSVLFFGIVQMAAK